MSRRLVVIVLVLLVVLLCWHEGILIIVPNALVEKSWSIVKYVATVLLTALIGSLLK